MDADQAEGGRPASPIIKAGSIASDVYLDTVAGVATKIYRPGVLVRGLYWLSFQAPFPYRANEDALQSARQRRLIANLILRPEFGREVVAQVIDVQRVGDHVHFLTELVPGTYPVRRREGREFLRRVSRILGDAGLDTWQVWRWNPKALGNLIEDPEGQFIIIDLESSLVTPPLPLSHIWNSIKTAQVPSFDDVNFPALRAYIDRQAARLHEVLGDEDYALLLEAVERCHQHMHAWKDSEPRIFGRSLRFLYRLLSRQTPPHM